MKGLHGAESSQMELAIMKTGTTGLRNSWRSTWTKSACLRRGLFVIALVASTVLVPGQLVADIVTVTTSLATGTSHRQNPVNFIGLLSSSAPPEIGGANVIMNNIPAGQSFQVGDIVGRDVNSTTGSRNWDYLLTLPGNAATGTGFTNIDFSGWIFENTASNLGADDQLSWQMFLNGSAIAVASSTVSDDFGPQAINLANAGGSTINQILVRFSVADYNDNDEWFMTRGTLSANYDAIPEPEMALLAVLGIALAVPGRNRPGRRRNSHDRQTLPGRVAG